MPLLQIKNLKTYFYLEGQESRAVDGLSCAVDAGETLGVVGESGCGKSVTALSILGLVPQPPGKIVDGEILFHGQNLLAMRERELRRLRGNKIAMIFQDPMTSLNPVYRVGGQIAEVLRLHRGLKRKDAWREAVCKLEEVGVPDPGVRAHAYPHELSGGLRQRVMIAMALACDPLLLIADEPTTALDVTIQAQILDLMKRIQRERGMAIMMITHSLGVVANICDRVAVMYAGRIVEQAPARALFQHPTHPYTIGLLDALPRTDDTRDRLHTIPGNVPHPAMKPSGCAFHPRCGIAEQPRCADAVQSLQEVAPHHAVACWKKTER